MHRTLIAAFALILAPLSAAATEAECRGQNDFHQPDFEPRLSVMVAPGPMTLLADSTSNPTCPRLNFECQLETEIEPGTEVVVTSTHGEFACVSLLTGKKSFTLVTGLLPSQVLVPSWPLLPDFVGNWRAQADVDQTISILGENSASVTAWGFSANQLPSGDVNYGSFTARVKPKYGYVAFSVDLEGNVSPYGTEPGVCAVKMWRLGEYLIVRDNSACGGAHVTFTGLYRRTGWI